MSIDHIIDEIYNSRIKDVILIDDITTLLDYKHQFMGSLYAVDSSRSWTRLSSHYYLHRVLTINSL